MKKTEVKKAISNGANPLVRTIMADGRYYGRKVNDDYTVLKEVDGKWTVINDDTEAKNSDIVLLHNCEDQKSKVSRTIAVNADYIDWPTKTNFSFTVKNGRTALSLEKLTDKQVKELVKE